MKRRRPQSLIDRAASAKRESKYVEFKESFDSTRGDEWCEIIKDIVAMANTGGGVITFGVENDGKRSHWDPSRMLKLDPAVITDKIARYTGEQFSDFEMHDLRRGRSRVAALEVRGVQIPLVFVQPGTYDVGGGKQKTAFARGTVYFRHGAKSEPAVSKDFRDFLDRQIENVRRSWLGNLRKVAEAPPGSAVTVMPPRSGLSAGSQPVSVRLVTDSSATPVTGVNYDLTHPYRQKELINLVNGRLGEGKRINSFDVHCVRRVQRVDTERPEFAYKPKFSTAQFSEVFVDWLVSEHDRDPQFFEKARSAHKGVTHP